MFIDVLTSEIFCAVWLSCEVNPEMPMAEFHVGARLTRVSAEWLRLVVVAAGGGGSSSKVTAETARFCEASASVRALIVRC